MADQNQAFIEWLKTVPDELAKLVAVFKKWYELQTPGVPAGNGPMPREWKLGDKVVLTTAPLSDAEIDALSHDMADAVVKERAIAFIKGFIAGLTVIGGAA